jgi:hypothetical protein
MDRCAKIPEKAAQCVREAQQFQIFPRKTFGLARKALGNPSKAFDASPPAATEISMKRALSKL